MPRICSWWASVAVDTDDSWSRSSSVSTLGMSSVFVIGSGIGNLSQQLASEAKQMLGDLSMQKPSKCLLCFSSGSVMLRSVRWGRRNDVPCRSKEAAVAATRPSHPSVNHLVVNVRDIEASHRFYCEGLGFEQCGQLETPFTSNIDMRFYRGHPDHHHDFALAQIPDPASAPPVPEWGDVHQPSRASPTSRWRTAPARSGWRSSSTCRRTGSRSRCAATTG